MAGLKFVGDISEFSDGQKEFIANVVQERGFEDVTIHIQPLGKIGDNFIANVKRIIVEKNGETLKMVAKVAPKLDIFRATGNTAAFFQNEHVMYTQVLPQFTELEKAANIPTEERLRYAACYGTYMEVPNEIILLEDLAIHGFTILDKFTSLTDENMRLILKNFAIFHSLSYALKYQEPEMFEELSNSLINIFIFMANIPELLGSMAQIETDVELVLDYGKHKKIVKNVITQMFANSLKMDKLHASSKYSVIQQGDTWTNNIMFRLEDENTEECCLIDYQLSHQGSPVGDLHYLIFTSTDYVTRMRHFHDWIDYYHMQLDKSLSNFGLKANYVYPKDQLDADLRRTAKFFLGRVIMVASVVVRETADAAVFKEAMNTGDPNLTMEELAQRTRLSTANPETLRNITAKIEGVLDSMIEFGYL